MLTREDGAAPDRAGRDRIPLAEPDLRGNELRYLSECVESGWISSIGPFVARFETELARRTGARYALSTANGTVALHLALAALGIGPGDEVLVPDLTFAASANAVLYCGATPVLVDVREEDWGMDPAQVEPLLTARTRAILAVHLYGHPCDADALAAIARRHGLALVEDAAESLAALYKGRPVGSLGDVACFSFYGNKIITTGEGGACVTSRDDLFERMGRLRDHGMNKSRRYWHDEVGFNYRMTSLQAAVGVAQLERLDEIVAAKRRNATRYREGLAGTGLGLSAECEWARSVFWMFNILLPEGAPLGRAGLAERLDRAGIDSRQVFFPLHLMPPYRNLVRPGQSFPVANRLGEGGLSLPSASVLADAEIDRVIATIEQAIQEPTWEMPGSAVITTS